MAGLAALQYSPDAFDTRVGKLMGRQMAGQTFLQAWIEHAGADPLTSWTEDPGKGRAFERHARELGFTGAIAAAQPSDVSALRHAGALWLADPSIANYAWQRRWLGQDAWSIVGITHTLSTHAALERVTNLLIAPVQPWDALICTSQAIRQTVNTVLQAQGEYLQARLGATRAAGPLLPVIPLGVPCDALAPDPAERARWRAELGLAEEDVAVVQFGRITMHGKAHPLPLYQALAAAGEKVGRPLHLILAGLFPNDLQRDIFGDLARAFAGRVTTHFVDGQAEGVAGIRAAADIGTLLADSIQETFGLAPVELMAAGLPVVASDWDGLRDTIEHGVTGFRVDTIVPPAGAGAILARRYATLDTLDQFHAATAQSTALDIAQATQAFAALAADGELRRRMGQAARERARRLFDWPVVIGAYRDLLAELAERRRAGEGERAPRRPGRPAVPWQPDPFRAFAAHATAALDDAMRVRRAASAPARAADLPAPPRATLMHATVLPPIETLDAIAARAGEGARIEEIGRDFPGVPAEQFVLAIGWLLKFGLIERA